VVGSGWFAADVSGAGDDEFSISEAAVLQLAKALIASIDNSAEWASPTRHLAENFTNSTPN